MSLTDFIADAVIRAELRAAFPRKPKFDLNGLPTLAPLTSPRPGLLGTALDYVARFYCEHLNPFATSKKWVAYGGRLKLELLGADDALIERADASLRAGRAAHKEVVASGTLDDDVMDAALRLAALDAIFRTGRFEDHWLDTPAQVDRDDLRAAVALLPHQSWLVASKRCLLNPIFGRASMLVGGADADLFLDDTLVELKMTKNLNLTREIYNQLLGYLVLQRIGGIGHLDNGKDQVARMGVYFARHGVFVSWDVREYVDGRRLRGFVNYVTWTLEEEEAERKARERERRERRQQRELTQTKHGFVHPLSAAAPGSVRAFGVARAS